MHTARFEIMSGGDPVIDHTISKLDLNYIQTGNVIGVGYVFGAALSPEHLKVSLSRLVSEFPPLAARLDLEAMCAAGPARGVPFDHVTGYPGAAADYAVPDMNIRNRTDFVNEPSRKDIERGRAPLMCVKLTEFTGGGCILGVTINHGLMDAAGFHFVMRRWSDHITGREGAPLAAPDDIYNFQTDRSRKERQDDIRDAGMAKPLNGNSLFGKWLTKTMLKILDGIRTRGREMTYFTAQEITDLKVTVRTEAMLDWISTNVALSAHILHAIIPLQMPGKSRTLSVGNVINIRGRVPGDHDAAGYLGNALYIMISELKPGKSIHDLSRGDIAVFLRRAFERLTPDHISAAMSNIVDSLDDGFGYPGLNIFKPIMAVNNQSKFDVYDVDFGEGRPLRVIPQDVGDHIMIFPAADGGTEVYIRDFVSLKRQKKLLEPEWQARLRAI